MRTVKVGLARVQRHENALAPQEGGSRAKGAGGRACFERPPSMAIAEKLSQEADVAEARLDNRPVAGDAFRERGRPRELGSQALVGYAGIS